MRRALYSKQIPYHGTHYLADRTITLIVYSPYFPSLTCQRTLIAER
nr:MAG TPA: hypothetical protein [Crassvirales sp.]